MKDATQLAVFLPGNRAAFEPGAMIDVTVLWALPRAPDSLEVRLFWTTRGKGTEDLEVVASERIPPAAAGEHVWRLTLPAGPWSFSGKLISLVWALEAVAREPAAVATCEFVIAPDARELRLDETAGTAPV